MSYRGRIFSVGVVFLFNLLRYYYYHVYFGLPFELSFFYLTFIFSIIAWWCGKQFDRAKFYSEKDPLTNTYNRRTIEQIFPKLIKSCTKENRKLAVIMIDLDDFKEVNDTLGHQQGDVLLKDIASLLQKVVGKENIVARWGGDEFVVFLHRMNGNSIASYIQKLQNERVERISLNATSEVMSIGLAVYPEDGTNLEALIQKADQAMYNAKRLKVST